MGQVTMCDACGLTSRVAGEMRKVSLPQEAMPEALRNTGGNTVTLDVCLRCTEILRDVLTTFVTNRGGGGMGEPVVEAAGVVESPPHDCGRDGHRFYGVPVCLECSATYRPEEVT